MTDANPYPLPDVDEALRIAGLNLRSLFDQFPFAVQVFSPDGRVLYRNPAQIALWGREVEQQPAERVIFDSRQLEALGLMPFIRRGFAGETVAIPATRYTHTQIPSLPEGGARWVRTILYPIKDEVGTIRAVVVMHIDVTEREEAQQGLEQRVEERTRELATLLDVSRTATSTLELQPLLGLVLDQIKLVLDYTSAAVVTRNGDGFRTAEYRGPLPREVVLSRDVSLNATPQTDAALMRGEVAIMPDVWGDGEDARLYRQNMGEEYLRTTASYLRCLMVAPLLQKGELVGGLVLTHHSPGHYTAHDGRLAQAIAGQVAGAIENARLFDQEHRTAQEMASLLEVARNLSSTLDLPTLLGTIADQVKLVAGYDGFSVVLMEAGTMRTIFRRAPSDVAPRDASALAMPVEQAGPLIEYLMRRESLIIDDVRADEPLARRYRQMLGDPAEIPHLRYVRSWMGVPLALQDRVIGLIVLAHSTPGYYTRHEADLLTAIASQAAVAIENARLYDEQRRSAQEMSSLLEVSRTISSTLELQALVGVIVDQIKVVADYHGASVLVVEGDVLRSLLRRAPTALESDREEGRAVPLRSMGVFLSYLMRREPIIIGDVRGDEPLARAFREIMGDPEQVPRLRYISSWMAVPLALQDRVVGTILLGHSTPGLYTAHQAELVMAIASQAAIAIENARLYGQAQKLAVLEERQRLARDLHDSVSQVLFSIGLGARTARTLLDRDDPQRAAASVEYLINLAEMGTAEMRALLFELRPESLAQEGLVAAIAKQAAALRARHNVDVDTSLCEEPAVSLDVKEALYRIAQEATHNTVKHARAARIRIALACDEREVSLDVRDDGQGFDPSGSFPGHLGLRSMLERVERLGGTLTIESAPGQGTAIRVRIPLRAGN